jgi:hypothetical protein
VVKKRAKKKPAGKPKAKPAPRPKIADRSRLDTKPLQEHIRKRIKELKSGEPAAAAEGAEQRIARLQAALDTLMDICYPSMDIPI